MMRIEHRTGRGGSTHRLHQKEISVDNIIKGDQDEEPLSTRGK